MTTARQSPNGHKVFPPPCSVENPKQTDPADLPTNKANNNQFASDDQVVDRQKGVSPRESHGDQELSRVTKSTPLLAHDKVQIDTNALPERCQFDQPTRMVVPSDEPERGIPPEHLPERCQFFFSDGRQCSMARSDIHPSLCRFHSEREDQLFGDPAPGGNVVGAALDLPELYSACRDLTTAAGVNRALAQVFRLLAQRRISRQEAATFGHLAQLLLRTISAMRADPTRIGVPSEHREPRDLSFSSPRREANAAPASCPEADDAASPPRKGYPPAAKVYPQVRFSDSGGVHRTPDTGDELSPPNKGALFAGNKVIPSPPSTDEGVAALGVSYNQRAQTVASNPRKMNTCAKPVSNPSKMNTYEIAELKVAHNEHLRKTGEVANAQVPSAGSPAYAAFAHAGVAAGTKQISPVRERRNAGVRNL